MCDIKIKQWANQTESFQNADCGGRKSTRPTRRALAPPPSRAPTLDFALRTLSGVDAALTSLIRASEESVSELLRENLYEFGRSLREENQPIYFVMPRLKLVAKQCLEALEFVHSLHLIHCE